MFGLTFSSDPLDGWTNRWIESKHKSDFGKFVLNAGKFYGDLDKDKGKRGWDQWSGPGGLPGRSPSHRTAWALPGAGQVEAGGSCLYL